MRFCTESLHNQPSLSFCGLLSFCSKAWVLLICLSYDYDLVKALQPQDTQQTPWLQSTIKWRLGIEECPPYLSISADGLIQGLAGCR